MSIPTVRSLFSVCVVISTACGNPAGTGIPMGPIREMVTSAEPASTTSATALVRPSDTASQASAPLVVDSAAVLAEIQRIFQTGKPTTDPNNSRSTCNPGWNPSRAWLVDYVREDLDVTIHGGAMDAADVSQVACLLSTSTLFTTVALGAARQSGPALLFELRFRVPNATHDRDKLTRFPPHDISTQPSATNASDDSWSISIDDIKLIGVVSGSTPRAMFVDSKGAPHISHVGDRLGDAPSGTWKIVRVGSHDVELVRDDASGKSTHRTFTFTPN